MAKKETKGTELNSGIVVRDSGIQVNESPLMPVIRPLIITLPPGASKAQIERAKVLNAYAYSQPKGWALKKNRLLKELEELANEPDPIVDPFAPKLSVGSPMPEELPE